MATRRAGDGVAAEGSRPARHASKTRQMRNRTGSQASAPVVRIWLAWALGVAVTLAIGRLTGAIGAAHGRVGGFLWPLWSWDFDLYRFVAHHGYTQGHVDPTYAFFPLWPALLWAARPLSDWVVPELVVVAATLAAFVGVARAAPRGDRRVIALTLACWPGSFVLALAYPDALALACGAWSCVLAVRGRPFAAGALALVAAVARPPAFLLAIPLAAVARPRWVAAAPIAGAVAVHAYFWARSDSPFAFARAQSNWHRGTASFGHWWDRLSDEPLLFVAAAALVVVLVVGLMRLRGASWLVPYALLVPLVVLAASTSATAVQVAQAAIVLPIAGLLWTLGRGYRIWAAFASAVLALSLLSGSVQSFGRQALFAFPLLWVPANGPAWLRARPVALLALAANVALCLTVTHWAP
jgi:hypothetical protein